MKIDMANFAVRSLRPHLLQHSVEYERSKFQELLDKQPSERLFSNFIAKSPKCDDVFDVGEIGYEQRKETQMIYKHGYDDVFCNKTFT